MLDRYIGLGLLVSLTLVMASGLAGCKSRVASGERSSEESAAQATATVWHDLVDRFVSPTAPFVAAIRPNALMESPVLASVDWWELFGALPVEGDPANPWDLLTANGLDASSIILVAGLGDESPGFRDSAEWFSRLASQPNADATWDAFQHDPSGYTGGFVGWRVVLPVTDGNRLASLAQTDRWALEHRPDLCPQGGCYQSRRGAFVVLRPSDGVLVLDLLVPIGQRPDQIQSLSPPGLALPGLPNLPPPEADAAAYFSGDLGRLLEEPRLLVDLVTVSAVGSRQIPVDAKPGFLFDGFRYLDGLLGSWASPEEIPAITIRFDGMSAALTVQTDTLRSGQVATITAITAGHRVDGNQAVAEDLLDQTISRGGPLVAARRELLGQLGGYAPAFLPLFYLRDVLGLAQTAEGGTIEATPSLLPVSITSGVLRLEPSKLVLRVELGVPEGISHQVYLNTVHTEDPPELQGVAGPCREFMDTGPRPDGIVDEISSFTYDSAGRIATESVDRAADRVLDYVAYYQYESADPLASLASRRIDLDLDGVWDDEIPAASNSAITETTETGSDGTSVRIRIEGEGERRVETRTVLAPSQLRLREETWLNEGSRSTLLQVSRFDYACWSVEPPRDLD